MFPTISGGQQSWGSCARQREHALEKRLWPRAVRVAGFGHRRSRDEIDRTREIVSGREAACILENNCSVDADQCRNGRQGAVGNCQ